MRTDPCRLRFTIPLVVLLGLSTLAAAQQRYIRPLVREPVDERHRVVLKGNVHPLARPQFEVATAPPDLPMERMLLVLKRSPEQETALLKLLDDQQDKSSPQYHKWVTPEQFGQQFGPADSDIQAVTSWLQSHGFEIEQVSKGRTVVEFSGTAAQVQEAFHTPIEKYMVKGEAHWANANNPEIPDALSAVVAGVRTLHNFYKQPLIRLSDERFSIPGQPGSAPQATSQSGAHALAPGDFAKIYNINPVYQAGIDGAGTALAVVGRSNIFLGDVLDFQNVFGLQLSIPTIVPNGPDPGNLGGIEEAEALLDVSWSGAVARGAAVRFVVSASTNTTDGVDLSELYIIDNDLGDVMTESFGICEAAVGGTDAAGIAALAEQAAAQGITYIVSSGDTGAAGCDHLSEARASGPVSVSVLASTPFNVAVGGTLFNENGHAGTYWNATNDNALTSAKSYIPENVWNESCTACPSGASPLAAGGGGASTFFSKPSWQAGVAGIPPDGERDLPDLSFTAAGHDPYLLCFEGSCEGGLLATVFGTSASAPSFAGVMALVREKAGSRQGQANYVLYRLAAAETLSQCNASKTSALPASNCIFNDVTVGNNAVPGETGYGTTGAKYQATVGYDLATGLGSVNVANLVNQWTSVAFRPTATTLTLNPQTLIHGNPTDVNIGVAPSSGSGTPSGDVSLITDLVNLAGPTQGVEFFKLTAGQFSLPFRGLPGGNYNVTAHYAGDGTFAASDSAPVPVTVSPEGSVTSLQVFAVDLNGNAIPYTTQVYGTPAYLKAQISGFSGQGTASGQVFFTDNGVGLVGNPYSLNSEGTAATAQGLLNIGAGQRSIVAHYAGDRGLDPSVSPAVAVTVLQASITTTVAASSDSVVQGSQILLTANLNTRSFGAGPSGTVTFLSGGTPIANAGNPAPISSFAGSGNVQNADYHAATGSALLLTDLPVGQNSITAQYSGDSSYMGSSSTATIVNVLADFSLATEAPSVTIASPGGSGTIMFTVTGQPGYNGSLNFLPKSCAGLPRESTCSFSPALVTGSGSTTLTISTAAAHNARLEGSGWWTTSFAAILTGVFLLGGASRRRSCGRLLSLMAFTLLITVAGCGGGGSGGGGGGGTRDPGTPVGSSTVTVTVNSGSITHFATFTLTVQ